MQYKILTWNVKGESSFGWNNKYNNPYIISSRLVDKFVKQEADIVVLTAFVISKGFDYLFERLQNEGYIWFTSTRSGKNGILIAVKREILKDDKELVNKLYEENTISSSIEECNILQVSLPLKFPLKCGKVIDITGCRMETGGFNSLREQYDHERRIFSEILLPLIRERQSDIQVVCGDFNNAKCYGILNEPYCYKNYIDKDNQELAQINYNLNIIKYFFDREGFAMADINKHGFAIPTYFTTYRGREVSIPDDHIFVRGGTCKKCEVLSSDGLSDHAIVIATIQIDE